MPVSTATETIGGVALAGSVAAKDLSLWGMVMGADFIVKFVMLLLLFASIYCWAIIFAKVKQMRALRKLTADFEQNFWSGMSLEALYSSSSQIEESPVVTVFKAGMKEWQRATQKNLMANEENRLQFKDRLERVLTLAVNKEAGKLETSIGFLASVGSVAPFVGLFGTVWGIMNSFQGIAATHNTSLVVVAPGIAEALLATAMGLIAAIPAVLAFNKFSQEISKFTDRLCNFSDEFLSIVTRHIQENA